MVLLPEFFPSIEGFQWDEGNATKNWTRHEVSQTEAEQVFLNRPIVVTAAASADVEPRHFALGQTDAGRQLAIVFTLRGSLLRVISGRPMSRRERISMAKRTLRKTLPTFGSEAEEREFWETHDTSPFVDWSQARVAVFPNLKPSTETISLRLPTALLSELKALANKYDVPYQSLLKVFLAERVARETTGALANRALQPTSRAQRRRTQKPRARAARG